jgi:phospholipid N-methyltransferase
LLVIGAPKFGRGEFLRQFLRRPRELGSITPSSRFLGRAILDRIDFRRARRVVELGPGSGVFTREVLGRLGPDGALLALDTNAEFVALLRRELPDPRLTVVRASAERIAEVVAEQGWDRADAVISGIPYTLLPRTTTDGIVRASWRALAPGGLFVAYQYSPYLRPFLRSVFGNCRLGLVLRNLPPAVVFVSRKEVAAGSSRGTRRAG